MEFIDGGVAAPQGFTTNGVLSGIKARRTKPDTAVIFSERMCAAAGVFTQNKVKAECVKLSKSHVSDGKAQAIIVNSGNANACTGEQGALAARRMAQAVANKLQLQETDVLVCSTGVIGQQLPVEKIEAKISDLVAGLSKEGHEAAREAIMTTDTRYKEAAVEIARQIRLRNISGMIIIDFINMKSKEYMEELVGVLKEEIRQDFVTCTFMDVTKLGLVELTRKKTYKSLKEMIQ